MKTRVRVIPTLLINDESLVKTIKFEKFNYIGDPVNTVKIFNELEVDEMVVLDISRGLGKKKPNFRLLENIANECFMPLSYGGGLTNLEDVKAIFSIGFEKVIINSANFDNNFLVEETSRIFGAQSVIASIDYRSNIFGNLSVYSRGGRLKQSFTPKEMAVELERRGAGEILLTSIDLEGTWKGYDLKTIKDVSSALTIPVIASGGAGSLEHIADAVRVGGASAVGIGSMVVYQKKDMGVLVNFPDKKKLKEIFERS